MKVIQNLKDKSQLFQIQTLTVAKALMELELLREII